MLSGDNRDTYTDPSPAKLYNLNNDVQYNQAKRFIDDHFHLIKPNVLDIGSGDGKVTAYIASLIGGPIIGVDISAERVNFANEIYGNNQLKFVTGNAITLNEQPEVVSTPHSTIVSFNTLHHIPKIMQPNLFTQVKNLLADDGVALFLIPGRSPELHDQIIATAASDKWKSYFSDFDLDRVRTYETADYYKTILHKAGFHHCEAIAVNESGGKELDFEGVKNFISGWLPHLAHLKLKNTDQFIQDEFIDDIVKLYFNAMNKNRQEKIIPKVTQNKIIGYASFFSRKPIAVTSTESANVLPLNDFKLRTG